MKLGEVFINANLTPITLINRGHYMNSFEPIFENKVCDKLIMTYSSNTRIQSKDVPALVPVIDSLVKGSVTVSSLFEICMINTASILSTVNYQKTTKTNIFDNNKLKNINFPKIVNHLIIHDISNRFTTITTAYVSLSRALRSQQWN